MVLNFAWTLGCWVEGAVATGGPGVCADFVCEPETPTEEAFAWRPETPREAISMIWPLGRGPGQILLGVKNGGQDRHDRMIAFRCVVSSKNSNSATGGFVPAKTAKRSEPVDMVNCIDGMRSHIVVISSKLSHTFGRARARTRTSVDRTTSTCRQLVVHSLRPPLSLEPLRRLIAKPRNQLPFFPPKSRVTEL